MTAQTSLFQILIAGPDAAPPGRSARLEENVASFRATYKGSDYRLYEDRDLRRFLSEECGARVLRAYDRLAPYAYKADLARYCLLHARGGFYSDLSHRHLRPIEVSPDTAMVVFRAPPDLQPWTINNGLVFARPSRRELAQVIRRILRHVETGFYGASPLDPTGPNLFGRVLAQSPDWRRFVIGHSAHSRTMLGARRGKGRAVHDRKILPDGTTVAEKVKRAAADVSEYIGARGNSYLRLWQRRQVWGELTIVLPGDDPMLAPGPGVAREADGLNVSAGHAGPRVTTPRLPLMPGSCHVRLSIGNASDRGRLTLDAVTPAGPVLAARPAGGGTDAPDFRFDVPAGLDHLQLRLCSDARFSGVLQRIEIIEGDNGFA